MTTTSHGYELARRFQIALREIEYAFEEIQAAQGKIVSRIAIGNIPHSATPILANAIKEFLAKYPTARVQIVDGHYEELLNALRAGTLDLLFGVLRKPDWASDVKEQLLFANPYVVVGRCGHPLHRLHRPKLQDLIQYDWIMPGPMTPRQHALDLLFSGYSDAPRVSIETTSLQIYRAILATTDRLILMSRFEAQFNDANATLLKVSLVLRISSASTASQHVSIGNRPPLICTSSKCCGLRRAAGAPAVRDPRQHIPERTA